MRRPTHRYIYEEEYSRKISQIKVTVAIGYRYLVKEETTPKAELHRRLRLSPARLYTSFVLWRYHLPVSWLKLTFRINTQVGAYTEFVLLERPVAASTHLHSVANETWMRYRKGLRWNVEVSRIIQACEWKPNTGTV